MKRVISQHFVQLSGFAMLAGLVAGCATEPVAVESAAPPPAVVIPPQPRPPLGAQANLSVPPLDAAGMRHMINYGITPAQTVWNLRSAFNVAALDCLRPEHAAILDGYKAFLKANIKALAAANRRVDTEFAAAKGGAGRAATRAREAYMTQVYNFYALPPTLPAFCDAALAMSTAASGIKPKEVDDFAAANLPKIDQVFLRFFDSYDQYRADLATWRARYAPTTPPAPSDASAAPLAPDSASLVVQQPGTRRN